MKKSSILTTLFLAAITVCLSNAQSVKILTPHLGYEPDAPKRAIIEGTSQDEITGYKIMDVNSGKEWAKGVPQRIGAVNKWKNWCFWKIDFDNLTAEGTYIVECDANKKSVSSFPFKIRKNILEYETISDVIYYFKGQRCSGQLDKADRKIKLDERSEVVDVHGGWFDATGDYGKHLSHLSFSTYFNPQQIPFTVWTLFKAYQRLGAKNDSSFMQYRRRLLDEAIYGADFLVRMKDPNGSFYRSVDGRGPGKKPEDRVISKEDQGILARLDSTEKTKRSISSSAPYETGYRQGAGFAIAALAFAATMNVDGDFSSKEYLKAAESAFDHLEKNNRIYLNDGQENIIDDYCALMASVELYKATKNAKYKTAADARAAELSNRLASDKNQQNYWRADAKDRPFFHAADAGMPVVCLLSYLDIAEAAQKTKVLDAVKKSMAHELSITEEVANPFGYSRQYVQEFDGHRKSSFFFPHKTETKYWWQGENARLGSMAAAARMASNYFKDDAAFSKKLQSFAWNQLNWILGENPFDVCMVQGSGRNNPPYMFINSIQYTNAPGGIVNGITSGYTDENDIDFNLFYKDTHQDDDWRWGEQWLPHATWYLLAVTSRE